MQNNAVTTVRRLLPRWRSLAKTPSHELPATRTPNRDKARPNSIQLENALARWEETKGLTDASEVIDAALISGKYSVAIPAAYSVLRDGNAVLGLNNAARQILGQVSDRPVSDLTSAGERDFKSIVARIVALKQRLYLLPRDAISTLEIARLQSLIGQTRSAERYVEQAVKLAPNDRYVLRSATRFWAHRSKPGDEQVLRALEAIWASDVVRVDPWVQAAEVAVANIIGRTPRWGVKTGSELIKSQPNLLQYSELAGGLATLELSAGAPIKKIRKLMRISLQSPTENALAQAVWARKTIGIDFDVDSYVKKIPNANEARARAAYENGAFELSVTECWNWLADEKFSARAALAGAFVSFCLLGDYKNSLTFAEQGLRANPNEPMLWNDKILALSYLGRAREAELILPHLEAFYDDPNFRPFVDAARGLVAFRLGNVGRGRDFYMKALDGSQELSKPSLVANATIFWLEQELFAGTTDAEEASKVCARLDQFYSRKENGAGNSPVWNIRKKFITQMMDQATMRKTVLDRTIHRFKTPAALLD